MNAQQCFLLAATMAGLQSFLMAAIYFLTSTNQPARDRHILMGVSFGALFMAFFFLGIALILKP